MKPRRLAMVLGGLAITALSVTGIVAEQLGIDTVLLVERLWQSTSPDNEGGQPADPLFAASDTAGDGHGEMSPDAESGVEAAAEENDKTHETAANVHEQSEEAASNPDGHDAEAAVAEAGNDEAHDGGGESASARSGEQPHGEAGENGAPHTQGSHFDARAHSLPQGENQPWRLFRHLQRAQDGIVSGKPGALEGYREEMARLGDEMLALPVDVWNHERNIISAAAYVMGGGKPALGRRLLERTEAQGTARTLLEGALAYAEGDYYKAYNLLYAIAPDSLPLSVAGQVALVRAMLVSPRSLEQAMDFLYEARRHAPGTLVEEAALRRQIRVLAEIDDIDGFFREAGAYVRRFSRSAFLSDFLRNFAFGALKLSQNHQQRVTREIKGVEAWMDPEARLYLFSLLARGATVFGEFELAREASMKSLDLTGDDPRLAQRLNLYMAAASLTWPERLPEAIQRLQSIDQELLGVEDKRLLRAALMIAEQIRRPLDEANLLMNAGGSAPHLAMPEDGTGPVDAAKGIEIEEEALPKILERSGSALKLADEALGW